MPKKNLHFLFITLCGLVNQQVNAQLTINTSATANVTRTPVSGATGGLVIYTATAPASAATLNVSAINADLVSGYNVTIDYSSTTQNLILNSNLIVSAAMANDATLTLKAAGSVVINPTDSIDATQNGNAKKLNLLLWTDSDNSGRGQVHVSNSTAATMSVIYTNGGNITMSGGTDPSIGFASTDRLGVSTKPYAGVDIYNTQIDADGGNILIRGAVAAIAGTGSYRAAYFECTIADTVSLVKTSGSGTISIYGDCSKSAAGTSRVAPNNWGINTNYVNFITDAGAITFNGWGGNLTNNNIRGESLNSTNILSTSGNINVIDYTSGASATAYTGVYVTNCFIGKGALAAATGNVTISADKIQLATLNEFNTTGNILFQSYHGNNFLSALAIPAANNFFNAAKIDIGLPANTSDVTIAADANVIALTGPMNIYGSNLSINRALSGPGHVISLNAITNAVQSDDGIITAGQLALSGSGSFSLQALNLVDILAAGTIANPVSSVSFHNSAELNIGTVAALATGINATGTISVATQSGNLNVLNNVSTTNAGLPAVSLYADSSRLAGDGTGGQVTLAPAAAVSSNAAGQVLLYSGNEAESTGLSSFVPSANVRSMVDRTVTTFSPTLTTGVYALYRASGALPIVMVNFTVACQVNKALLNWVTANGVMDKYFEVQNSIDGTTWNNIAKVFSSQQPTAANYSYADNNPTAKSLYRLKLVGADAEVTYSKIIMLNCGATINTAPAISVYPNPATDLLYITSVEGKFQYKVCDDMGRQVISGYSENTNTPINVKQLNAGVYFVIVSKDKEHIGTYKVIIK